MRAHPVAPAGRPEPVRQAVREPALHAPGRYRDDLGDERVGHRRREDVGERVGEVSERSARCRCSTASPTAVGGRRWPAPLARAARAVLDRGLPRPFHAVQPRACPRRLRAAGRRGAVVHKQPPRAYGRRGSHTIERSSRRTDNEMMGSSRSRGRRGPVPTARGTTWLTGRRVRPIGLRGCRFRTRVTVPEQVSPGPGRAARRRRPPPRPPHRPRAADLLLAQPGRADGRREPPVGLRHRRQGDLPDPRGRRGRRPRAGEPGRAPLPYLCARSRHGHYHLTTDRAAVPCNGASAAGATGRRRADAPPGRSVRPVDGVSALHRRIPTGPAAARHPPDIPQQRRPPDGGRPRSGRCRVSSGEPTELSSKRPRGRPPSILSRMSLDDLLCLQGGVVTLRQAVDLGLSRATVQRRRGDVATAASRGTS